MLCRDGGLTAASYLLRSQRLWLTPEAHVRRTSAPPSHVNHFPSCPSPVHSPIHLLPSNPLPGARSPYRPPSLVLLTPRCRYNLCRIFTHPHQSSPVPTPGLAPLSLPPPPSLLPSSLLPLLPPPPSPPPPSLLPSPRWQT